jgi:hypothetical protein
MFTLAHSFTIPNPMKRPIPSNLEGYIMRVGYAHTLLNNKAFSRCWLFLVVSITFIPKVQF